MILIHLKGLIKVCLFLFPLISFLISLPAYGQKYRIKVDNIQETQELFTYTKKQRIPIICSHEGGQTPYPKNTIEAFQYTFEKAPVTFECYVQMTKDKEFVLYADSALESGSNGQGLLKEHSLAEIKTLRRKDTSGQLTSVPFSELKDVLDWARDRTIIFIQPDKDVSLLHLVEKLEEWDANHLVVFLSVAKLDAKKMYVLNPSIMQLRIVRNKKELEERMDSRIPTDRWMAFTGKTESKKTFYSKIHRQGVLVAFSVLGEADRLASVERKNYYKRYYKKLFKRGIDIIYTDYPEKAFEGVQKPFQKADNPKKRFFQKVE